MCGLVFLENVSWARHGLGVGEPFKNLLGPATVERVARALAQALPSADVRTFRRRALAGLEPLEMKARAAHVAKELSAALPADFDLAATVLCSMLADPATTDEIPSQDAHPIGLAGWAVWPLTMVIADLGRDHPERALLALREMTQRFTSEFAVRGFLRDHPKKTLAFFRKWTRDPNPHVRRWVSEGSRPRLPWGIRLESFVADPSPTIPLLVALRDDESPYVRRSVANHLNDITKDHPELFADLLHEWLVDAPEPRKKLLAHASRSLVKSGHPRVLRAFGADAAFVGEATLALSPSRIRVGESVALELTLVSRAKKPQKLVIDYVVHHVRANGKSSPKVFKGWKSTLGAGETLELSRNHSMKPVTTRRYYPGNHTLSCRVNGRDIAEASFELLVP